MGLFSAIIGGVEHTAEDFGSLLESATNDVESLGISMVGGTYQLVKFLLEAGEDPIAAIQQITSCIENVGGDIMSTLDELGSGIFQYGLYGFAQKKANDLFTPLQNSLHQNTARGQTIASLHQTTIRTMQARLDALKASGWQGQNTEAMQLSFNTISTNLTSLSNPLDSGGAQGALNTTCEIAITGIIIVGGVVIVCEIAAACIVAVAGLATGPGEVIVAPVDGAALAASIAATLALMLQFIGSALAIWLAGTMLIYVIEQIKINIVYATELDTSSGKVRARKLTSREVKGLSEDGQPFEKIKKKLGYPANADIWVDQDGNYWITMPGSNYAEPFP